MRRLAALLLCLPLVLSACGGKDKDAPNLTEKGAYQAQVAGALGPVILETGRIAVAAPQIGSAQAFAARAQILERAYADAADVLATIVPPDDIGDLHHELVVASQHLAQDTSQALQDLLAGRGDLSAFKDAAKRYSDQLGVLEKDFAAKGFDVIAAQPASG
ncbi:MAG: hypothetical protein QOD60_122 [Solirubrobacterales bacterium]|jgi:hypothetical protein|nr:hypothetical protein [Solirubrobacterales bacterium]